MTSWNGNVFRIALPLCGKSTYYMWIPLTTGLWYGALVFSRACVCLGGWVGGERQQPSGSLENKCQVACLWLGCCKGIYFPSYYHITTCDIGVVEKHDLLFDHNWLSKWLEIQYQIANCIILIEGCYNWLKLKSTCSHWIRSLYLRLIQFLSLINSPSYTHTLQWYYRDTIYQDTCNMELFWFVMICNDIHSAVFSHLLFVE